MSDFNTIKKCEVCNNTSLKSVINLGHHPLCDDLISVNSSATCKLYPIEILFCDRCKTAHQKHQVRKVDLFPDSYHYRSRFTADVLRGMSNLVNCTETHLKTLENKLVVDIGCNDGSLLDFFEKKGARTIGVEPTSAYKDSLDKGHLVFNEYFSQKTAIQILDEFGSPDIITFTNVFAHIENLPELIAALKVLICDNTMIVIENHYLGSILESNQFDTFYHEHPRTYSLSSFSYIAKNIGFNIVDVEFPNRYGGNIRIFMARESSLIESTALKKLIQEEDTFEKKFCDLPIWIENWQNTTKSKIEKLYKENGKLSAKAFPGRAAILIKLLDLDEEIIDAVYEKPGSLKIGHYLPGTRIPIKSDNELFEKITNVKSVLNLAWHIPGEIERYLRGNNFSGEIINIID